MSTLEKISKALAGETLTGLARGAGEAIGYVGAGGDLSDVPQVMKDAIEAQKARTETASQGEKDAYSALSALGLVTNPASQIGMGIDFVKSLPGLVSAIPERAKSYLAGEMEPAGTIAEGGLKRRLMKSGAQAKYALQQRASRIDNAIGSDYQSGANKMARMGLPSPTGGYATDMSRSAVDAITRQQRQALPLEQFSQDQQQFIKYLDAKKLNQPMEYHHYGINRDLVPFYEPQILEQIKTAIPELEQKALVSKRPKQEPFAPIPSDKQILSIKPQERLQQMRSQKFFYNPDFVAQYKALQQDEIALYLSDDPMKAEKISQLRQQMQQLIDNTPLTTEDIKRQRP